MDDNADLGRQVGAVLDRMGGPEPTFDAMVITRSAATQSLPWRSRSRFGTATTVLAAVVVALFGAVVLDMTFMRSPGQDQVSGVAASASTPPGRTAMPSPATEATLLLPSATTTDFSVPFSYTMPNGLHPSATYEDNEVLTLVVADDGTYAESPRLFGAVQRDAPDTEARGILVADVTETYASTCSDENPRSAYTLLRSDPAGFLEDLQGVPGLRLEGVTTTTLGGRTAMEASTVLARCGRAEIIVGSRPIWEAYAPLDIPSRIIVAQVGDTTVMAQVWAGTPIDLESWLPVAQEFLDSIEFAGDQGDAPAASLAPAEQGRFTPSGSLPPGRWAETLFALADGRAVAIGQPNGSGATAEVWDPATGTFSQAGSLSETHEFGGSAKLSDGRVLVAGGLHSSYSQGPTDAAAVWDPSTNDFRPTGSLRAALLSPLAVTLPDDRVLMVADTATPELWEPTTESFEEIAIAGRSCGSPLRALDREMDTLASATALPDGRVLILGQVMASLGSQRPCTEVWDVDAGTATELDLGLADTSPDSATVLADGRVVIFSTGHDGTDVIAWDPTSGESVPGGALPGRMGGFRTVRLTDGRVLVVGGFDQGGDPVASAELWNPGSLSFEPTGDLREARGEAPVALLQDGRVLVAGGRFSSAAIEGGPSTTEVFALR